MARTGWGGDSERVPAFTQAFVWRELFVGHGDESLGWIMQFPGGVQRIGMIGLGMMNIAVAEPAARAVISFAVFSREDLTMIWKKQTLGGLEEPRCDERLGEVPRCRRRERSAGLPSRLAQPLCPDVRLQDGLGTRFLSHAVLCAGSNRQLETDPSNYNPACLP